ncbi:MAG: hypothetical protein JXA73_20520 [Acidobacteria bacterium]|nr:hypothetical protein [Acidobacteriota bacterium]
MKPIQDDELERALAQHPLKGPREGLRERVLTNSQAAWSRSAPMQRACRFQISWTLSGWLAIAATLLFLLNIGVDSFNRNSFHTQFGVNTSRDDISNITAVQAFADALRQQTQVLQSSEFFYR